MKNITITSLAILKANYDRGKDYLDNLRPFISYVISKDNRKQFASMQIQQLIEKEFGLKIPLRPLELVFKRLVREGKMRRAGGKFHRKNLPDSTANVERERSFFLRTQNAVTEDFRSYIEQRFLVKWSSEEAEEALYNYINDYSIECVTAYQKAQIVPIIGKSTRNTRFLISHYLNHVSSGDPQKFDYFVTIVKARMLASAFLGEELSEHGVKFKNTTVYLDTGLILRLLGVAENNHQIITLETMELLREANARLAVFDHTLEEVEYVLKRLEKELDIGSISEGETVASLREMGRSASDVAMIRAQLRESLEEHAIKVEESPDYIAKFQIDELLLEECFIKEELKYNHDIVKRKDINSIRSIYVRRSGMCPRRIEEARALMMTTNIALARAAYTYGKQHEESREVSTVITDFSLTNILWIKSPMRQPDLPKRLITASCFSVLRPSEKLWSKFILEIDKLKNNKKITTEQHQFLRFDLKAKAELVEMTRDDEDRIDDDFIAAMISRYESSLLKPVEDKLHAEANAHSNTKAKFQETSAMLVTHQERENGLYRTAATYGKQANQVTTWFSGIAVLAALIYLNWPGRSVPSSPLFASVIKWLVIIVVVWSAIDTVFGFNLRSPINRIASFVEGVVRQRMLKFYGLPSNLQFNVDLHTTPVKLRSNNLVSTPVSEKITQLNEG